MNELIVVDNEKVTKNLTKASSTPALKKTVKVSYRTLRKAAGEAATGLTIASLLLSFCSAAVAIPVVTTAAIIGSLMAGTTSLILSKIKKGSTSHGVSVFLERRTQTKYQSGHKFKVYSYGVHKVGTY